MAWVTGKHAEAPQGVLCYVVADQPAGEVTWYQDEEAEQAQAQRRAEPAPRRSEPAPAAATPPPETKRG